jgi:hypothetical protein
MPRRVRFNTRCSKRNRLRPLPNPFHLGAFLARINNPRAFPPQSARFPPQLPGALLLMIRSPRNRLFQRYNPRPLRRTYAGRVAPLRGSGLETVSPAGNAIAAPGVNFPRGRGLERGLLRGGCNGPAPPGDLVEIQPPHRCGGKGWRDNAHLGGEGGSGRDQNSAARGQPEG